MNLVYANSFDAGGNLSTYTSDRDIDPEARWCFAANLEPSPLYARTGTGGIAPSGFYGRRKITPYYLPLPSGGYSSGYWNIGKALKNVSGMQPAPGINIISFLHLGDSEDVQWILRTEANGSLGLLGRNGSGSIYVSPSDTLPLGGWFSLEVRAYMSTDSTGYMTVYIDGVAVIDVHDFVTMFATSGFKTAAVDFGAPLGFYVDDLFITSNDLDYYQRLGDVRVYALFPNGNGTINPPRNEPYDVVGAPADWDAVNEAVSDGDASYITADDHRITHEASFSVTHLPDPLPGGIGIGYQVSGAVRALHLSAAFPFMYFSGFTETSRGEFGQTYLSSTQFDGWTDYYILYSTTKDTGDVDDLLNGAEFNYIMNDDSLNGFDPPVPTTIGFAMTQTFVEAAIGGCPYGGIAVRPGVNMSQIVG